MIKMLLIIRLVVEAMFGLVCMAALFLLPELWKGTFPQQLIIAIIGLLGMPHRHHASARFQRFNAVTLGGLLTVTIVLLIGALCFKDVVKKIRALRMSHHES